MTFQRNLLVTGGAGFIGSHVVRLLVNKYPQYRIVNLDKLTYAGNLANLADIENAPNYTFVKADICDFEKMLETFRTYRIDGVIHLAAESHVDRSTWLSAARCMTPSIRYVRKVSSIFSKSQMSAFTKV